MNLLEVKKLNIFFQTLHGQIHAIRDLSFGLNQGESLGIVGESGCGKSISSLALMGLLAHNSSVKADSIKFKDIDLTNASNKDWQKVRGKKIAMIFQDPMSSLNPSLSVEYQISESLKRHTDLKNKKEIQDRCIELLDLVGIPDARNRLKVYPHQLSGGMCQRVMIAITLASEPDLLIADEPTTALDVTIQAQILHLLKKLQEEKNMGLILITHDLAVVSQMSDRLMVMYAGEKIETGSTKEIIQAPHHPYTEGLLKSLPSLQKGNELYSIPGRVPDLLNRPPACQFEPRCPYAQEQCKNQQLDKSLSPLCLAPINQGSLS